MSEIKPERLAELERLTLLEGTHRSFTEGVCAMEAVAWLAGEPHSDSPECACPVVAEFVRRWNDIGGQEIRDRLKAYLPRIVGSRSTMAIEEARGWLAIDWLSRTVAPAWLELAGLKDQAEVLRALPELLTKSSCEAALPTIRKALQAADAAASAAENARVKGAKRSAAQAAAAAWAAANAAANAVTAFDAAGAAAWAVVEEKLKPTKLSLRDSAFGLLDRMLRLVETQ